MICNLTGKNFNGKEWANQQIIEADMRQTIKVREKTCPKKKGVREAKATNIDTGFKGPVLSGKYKRKKGKVWETIVPPQACWASVPPTPSVPPIRGRWRTWGANLGQVGFMDLLVSQSAFETFIALSNVSGPTSYSVIDLDIGVDSDDADDHIHCVKSLYGKIQVTRLHSGLVGPGAGIYHCTSPVVQSSFLFVSSICFTKS